MTELDRVYTELRDLREQAADTQVIAARTEERIADFILRAEDRQQKQSERLKAVELEQVATSKELYAIKLWAIAAGVLVPGTLGGIAWLLSRIPPGAWAGVVGGNQ